VDFEKKVKLFDKKLEVSNETLIFSENFFQSLNAIDDKNDGFANPN
jgi:hypothetical protein